MIMKIDRLYSAPIYEKIMLAEQDKKNDIYRYEMMIPFKGKWDCYHIPMKADKPGGYDIIMASDMLGILPPTEIDEGYREWIDALADETLWNACQRSVETALQRFVDMGIELKVNNYLFSILLANPRSPYTTLCDGYSGDGGIPGYIMGWLTPNDNTLRRLPAAIAHETNHNVRFQHIAWRNDITLGEMIVSEGLAENYATAIFGEEYLGPWVTKADVELMPLIKEILYDALTVKGMDEITSYLYGDEMAELQNYSKVGLPYCAGYATGYYLIRYFLKKTDIPIEKATVMPAEDILREVEEFWTTDIV